MRLRKDWNLKKYDFTQGRGRDKIKIQPPLIGVIEKLCKFKNLKLLVVRLKCYNKLLNLISFLVVKLK